jgi:hypothetical protein
MSEVLSLIVLALPVAGVVWLNLTAHWSQHEWHHAFRHGWMRRKINGEWQYREATEMEAYERFSSEAW